MSTPSGASSTRGRRALRAIGRSGSPRAAGWRATLARRFRYGTSAAPLARRHPGYLAPLELSPWPTAGAAAALSGHPGTAAGIVGTWTASLARRAGPPVCRRPCRCGGPPAARRRPHWAQAGPPPSWRSRYWPWRSPAPVAPGGPHWLWHRPAARRLVAEAARARSGRLDGGVTGRRPGVRGRSLGRLPTGTHAAAPAAGRAPRWPPPAQGRTGRLPRAGATGVDGDILPVQEPDLPGSRGAPCH